MIAKGNTHDSGPKLVSYILVTAEEGERVEFGGARGFDFFSARRAPGGGDHAADRR